MCTYLHDSDISESHWNTIHCTGTMFLHSGRVSLWTASIPPYMMYSSIQYALTPFKMYWFSMLTHCIYSGTPYWGWQPWNEDTSVNQDTFGYPKHPVYVCYNLWKKDTSLIRALSFAQRVSRLEKFHSVPKMYNFTMWCLPSHFSGDVIDWAHEPYS